MHSLEVELVKQRLAEAEEPQLLFVGPSGAHLVPADTELVGCYTDRTTEHEIRQDLAAIREVKNG